MKEKLSRKILAFSSVACIVEMRTVLKACIADTAQKQ